VSVFAVILLFAAVVLLAATHWPSLSERAPRVRPPGRRRSRRKPRLHVVETEDEDFVRAVERDLAALPTIDEQDAKNR
jgi:hypothetical protein